MKCVYILLIGLVITSCEEEREVSSIDPVNWEKRTIQINGRDSLIKGSTYLSVYSDIYHLNSTRTFSLTVTISMRNISSIDSVFVTKANYYNTDGNLIRSYFDKPIYIKPLETVEIIIEQNAKEGGTGDNFIFEWASTKIENEPFFEAVMISTSGQQGLSFRTQGIKRQE